MGEVMTATWGTDTEVLGEVVMGHCTWFPSSVSSAPGEKLHVLFTVTGVSRQCTGCHCTEW